MKRKVRNSQVFERYGLSSDLSELLANKGLSVSKARALTKRDLIQLYGLSDAQSIQIKDAVERQPIDNNIIDILLERSNYTCNICKGTKSHSFIIHHIVPYAESQDNSYSNLIVLCPSDHDLAHNSGLSLGISKKQLLKAKANWEAFIENQNATKAAKLVEVDEGAIDYVNISRIEELCMQVFGEIPETTRSHSLRRAGIIDSSGHFREKFVRDNLSHGAYLFDYIYAGEASHYRELLAKALERIDISDLSDAIDHGKKAVSALEGKYAFFIGGVYSTRPELPITSATPPIVMHYTKRKIRVEWVLDPRFFMSMSSISRQGTPNRYIIYCLVRSINLDPAQGITLVKASPFIIGQPSKYKNRIPAVAWKRLTMDLVDL